MSDEQDWKDNALAGGNKDRDHLLKENGRLFVENTQLTHDLAAANAKIEEALAFIQHEECEDCWYSCPKSPDGCCNDAAGDECTCGSDRLLAILSRDTPEGE